jgi:hypothetical protein
MFLQTILMFHIRARRFGVPKIARGQSPRTTLPVAQNAPDFDTVVRKAKKMDSRGIEPRTTPSRISMSFDEAARC